MAEFEPYSPLKDREQVLEKFGRVLSRRADPTDRAAFELTVDVHASIVEVPEEEVVVEDINGRETAIGYYLSDRGETSYVSSLPDFSTDGRLNLSFIRQPDGSIVLEEFDFVADRYLPIALTPGQRISYLRALRSLYQGDLGQLFAR